MYDYGLIGNCQTAALVSRTASIDWFCAPRPDSPPVFGRLLDPEGGHFSIEVDGACESRQHYVPNTNVLITDVRLPNGDEFRVTDFCPRFQQHGRMYRPISVFRIIEPVKGAPFIRVQCRPVEGWSKRPIKPDRGNSHLRFDLEQGYLRVVTNMPLTYFCEESSFGLKEPLYFGLTWSSGIEDDLAKVAHSFLEQTIQYWRRWVQECSIPSLFQKEAIRSALALKLHCYEDTGAILAGLTTSLPEENGAGRNWDYRFCWLRDAYFVLTAFYNLGHFAELEGFLNFLVNIGERHEHSRERLRPVYRLDQSLPLPEKEHANWAGFNSNRPVRSDNQAAEHVQNDVYGEMVLTLAPIFFDDRFLHMRDKHCRELMGHLTRLCARNISQPDAGLWEIRDGWREHSFSNLMCWAGLERAERLQKKGLLDELGLNVGEARAQAERAIRAAVREGSLRNGPADDSFDSALLLLPILRFPDADICFNTVRRVQEELGFPDGKGETPVNPSYLFRYLRQDDFGRPDSAFLICSFWLVQALAKTGQLDRARAVMADLLGASNEIGLYSEHFVPVPQRKQLGNFPQAYSHVGLINAAFAISPPWDETL